MGKSNTPLMTYNKTNLNKVVRSIKMHLTQDLLPKKFLAQNDCNPMFGHCHNASGCLYKIFGSQNVHMYRAKDDFDIYHWWIVDKHGVIVDVTRTQYSERHANRIHGRGEKAYLLGFEYKKRVLTLLERVKSDLGLV